MYTHRLELKEVWLTQTGFTVVLFVGLYLKASLSRSFPGVKLEVRHSNSFYV